MNDFEDRVPVGECFDNEPFDPVAATLDFDGEPAAPVEPATLERLSSLAHQMVALEKEIHSDTVALAEKQAEYDKLNQRTIPDIMQELAMADFTLTDGSKLEVKDDIKTHISEENRPVAHKWLREHDFDGIIKTKVIAEFGKGELEKAEAAQKKLADEGFDSSLSESVHPSTLKSFVKERLEAGDNIPVAAFGIFETKKTKITAPKAKKARRA